MISGKGMSDSVTAIVTQAMQASLGNYRREASTDLVRKLVELAHQDEIYNHQELREQRRENLRDQRQRDQTDSVAPNAGAVRLCAWVASHFGKPESETFDKPAVREYVDM